MAGFVLGAQKTDAKSFGHDTIVSNNAKSKLMYYLSCVNTLLKSKGEQTDREMRKLCDYKNHSRLSEKDVDQLILLCYLLSPDILLNKCVFVSDELSEPYDNNFFEINKISHRFVITREVMIGGEQRRVTRVMTCRASWLKENYMTPMEHFKGRLEGILNQRRAEPPQVQGQQQTSDPWCSIS